MPPPPPPHHSRSTVSANGPGLAPMKIISMEVIVDNRENILRSARCLKRGAKQKLLLYFESAYVSNKYKQLTAARLIGRLIQLQARGMHGVLKLLLSPIFHIHCHVINSVLDGIFSKRDVFDHSNTDLSSHVGVGLTSFTIEKYQVSNSKNILSSFTEAICYRMPNFRNEIMGKKWLTESPSGDGQER